MKKVLSLIFLSLFIVSNNFAQSEQDYIISGKITDSISNLPLEYATITFTNKSTKELTGTISDKNGDFEISTSKGDYSFVVEFLSYKEVVKPNFSIHSNINIGFIVLSPKAESLNTIDISGKTPLTSIKLGKTVYNVEKDIAAQGGTINDILGSTPSISVINGVPTIRGSIATVLINGRVSSMTKTEALENLQASSIKKIEVITSPTAKYTADSKGGIINIILKKGIDNGWSGSITTTGGIKNVYGGAATLNYRKNKFNFYSNTSYFQRERIGSSFIENEYFSNGITEEFLTEKRTNNRKTNVLNTMFGIDYYINKNSSINVEGGFANFDGNIDRTNDYNFSDSLNNLTNSIQQLTYTDHLNDIYEFSTTYSNYFDEEGKKLTLFLSHKVDNENNNGEVFFQEQYPNQLPLPDNNELFYDNLDFDQTRWQASYVFPINESSNIEIGTDGEMGQLIFDYKNEIVFNGEFVIDPLNSDRLVYNEDVFGFYAEFDGGNEKFSYLLGLRTESTNLNMDFAASQMKINKNYTDIFPSATFQYTINEDKTLELYYSRGIQRVTHQYVYPFEQKISETTSFKGNPELLPYYSSSIELSILKLNEDQKFTIKPSIYFRNYDNIWQYITIETGQIVNEVPKLITTPINLGYLNFTGIELLANFSPTEKINFTGSVDGKYAVQRGYYEYTNLNNELIVLNYSNSSFTGSASFTADITFARDYHFQSDFNYLLSSEGAYSKRYDYGYANASISKDVFKNAGSIAIAANDIFNSNKTKRLRFTDNVNSMRDSQWREPSILFTFTYRFNQSKKEKVIDIDRKDEKEKFD